jgi:hypothetical protein
LLALNAVLVPVGALVPPDVQPKIMIPIGLALVWLGYALFSERQEKPSESLLDHRIAKPKLSKVA